MADISAERPGWVLERIAAAEAQVAKELKHELGIRLYLLPDLRNLIADYESGEFTSRQLTELVGGAVTLAIDKYRLATSKEQANG